MLFTAGTAERKTVALLGDSVISGLADSSTAQTPRPEKREVELMLVFFIE
jgi:hypothetical protein